MSKEFMLNPTTILEVRRSRIRGAIDGKEDPFRFRVAWLIWLIL
jgi:hypothetical protein